MEVDNTGTQVADLGQGRQIVRVKNCSGWTEPMWCGSWAPDDTNWANVSDAIRRELDGEAFHDGGFWIGFQVGLICQFSTDFFN